jgi:2'-phosphotransferase
MNFLQKRFVLDDSTQPPRIRAAQGHSVALEDPVLEAVTDASAVPCAVHVTSASRCACAIVERTSQC